MHELSLCQSILETAQEYAHGRPGRVKQIILEMGQLAMIDINALQFGFEVVTQGSIAEACELVITTVPAKASCKNCGETVTIEQYYDPCPMCQQHHLTILSGETLTIKSMVVG